jgi:hypothetical protein
MATTTIEKVEVKKSSIMETRSKILEFERRMNKIPGVKHGDIEECPLTHKFADGVYVREIFIPKGWLIVGKIHKHSHPNFLLKGEVSVVTEENGEERLKAPLSIISPAGAKRIVFTHEDTVWITVHVTKETDLKKIEDEVIAKTYNELPGKENLKLETKEINDPSEIKLMR